MKKRLLFLVNLILMATVLVSCSNSNNGLTVQTTSEPTEQATAETKPMANTPPNTVETSSLTEAEARKIAQEWIDSHPFQLGSNLEPGSGEQIVKGTEYYSFNLGIVRYAAVIILVNKKTGVLFHYSSPGSTTLEPLDDWYNREHSPSSWADSAEWITVSSDWMCIDIPPSWSWSYGPDYPDLADIDIYSADGSMHIFAGYIIAGNPEDYLAENPSEPFIFDSGTVGYMLESAERIIWLNPDIFLGSGVCFYHDGNRASFTNNKDLILRIARSYRNN